VGRSVRPWLLALAGSLLLHAGLIGGLDRLLPHWDSAPEPSPFDVQLVSKPVPVAAAPTPSPTSPAKPSTRPSQPRLSLPPVAIPAPEPLFEPAEAVAVPEAHADAESSGAVVVQGEDVPIAEPAPVEVAPPLLNPLPPRLDLRFQVRYGLASGEQTLLWVNEGGRYTLTSVAAATGLTGLFYRGRFVQTSRGRITPHGLQPEEFWDQRGDKRSSARFDTANGHLTLTPSKGAPRHFAYQGEVQDVLSLFFQLALTAPPPSGRLGYTVFNGKKLRDYVYEVRGEENLETPLGMLRTLHLVRVTEGDGRFEAWLALDRHYLPVRVLKRDEDGGDAELRLQSIAP
jgi:hypothetical protein